LDSSCRLPWRPLRVLDRLSGRPDPALRPARPCGRRTDPRGVSRAYRGSGEESSVGMASTLPSIRFGGVTVFLSPPRIANVSWRTASHSLARPSRARTGGSTPGHKDRTTPSRAFLPYSAFRATGSVITGVCHARHLPSSAFRAPSTACTPRPLPGLFRPGNAPGVPSSGAFTAREVRASLEAGALLSFGRPSPDRVKQPGTRHATSEPSSSQTFVPRGPKPDRGRSPPDVHPSKALRAPGVRQAL